VRSPWTENSALFYPPYPFLSGCHAAESRDASSVHNISNTLEIALVRLVLSSGYRQRAFSAVYTLYGAQRPRFCHFCSSTGQPESTSIMDFQLPVVPDNQSDVKRASGSHEDVDAISSADWKALPAHSNTKLCLSCSRLDIEKLLSGGEIQHHASYMNLIASGSSGCELCRLVTKVGPGDADLTPGKGKIMCMVEFDFDHKEFMVALKFASECGSFERQIGFCTTDGQQVPSNS